MTISAHTVLPTTKPLAEATPLLNRVVPALISPGRITAAGLFGLFALVGFALDGYLLFELSPWSLFAAWQPLPVFWTILLSAAILSIHMTIAFLPPSRTRWYSVQIVVLGLLETTLLALQIAFKSLSYQALPFDFLGGVRVAALVMQGPACLYSLWAILQAFVPHQSQPMLIHLHPVHLWSRVICWILLSGAFIALIISISLEGVVVDSFIWDPFIYPYFCEYYPFLCQQAFRVGQTTVFFSASLWLLPPVFLVSIQDALPFWVLAIQVGIISVLALVQIGILVVSSILVDAAFPGDAAFLSFCVLSLVCNLATIVGLACRLWSQRSSLRHHYETGFVN